MKANIDEIADFYKDLIQRTSDVKDFTEFESNLEVGKKIYELSIDICNKYFGIIKGIEREKYPNMLSMCFPQRFLKVDSAGDLGVKNLLDLSVIISNCFYCGMFFHFIYMKFPTRQNYQDVDFDGLFDEWVHNSMIADLQMKEYDERNGKLPSTVFKRFYEDRKFESTFKTVFKVGYFKRGRVQSFMKNVFFSGAQFAMFYDLRTNKE